MKTVAVLCARKRSTYREFPGVEIFDEQRDAWTFRGGMPVVAHPPCRRFGRLSHYVRSEDDGSELRLALRCVEMVRENGGVLEHPAGSSLWSAAGLPQPGGQPGADGFTVEIPQYWFGHLGRKLTWLYVAGVARAALPEIPLRIEASDRRPVEGLSIRQRESTPVALCAWLLSVARVAAVSVFV